MSQRYPRRAQSSLFSTAAVHGPGTGTHRGRNGACNLRLYSLDNTSSSKRRSREVGVDVSLLSLPEGSNWPRVAAVGQLRVGVVNDGPPAVLPYTSQGVDVSRGGAPPIEYKSRWRADDAIVGTSSATLAPFQLTRHLCLCRCFGIKRRTRFSCSIQAYICAFSARLEWYVFGNSVWARWRDFSR